MRQRQFVDLPKQGSPSTPDRVACAPYNFIPLPETVVTAVSKAEDLPDHNRYYPELLENDHDEKKVPRYTGHFMVTLKTLSPLYIRGGLSTKRVGNDMSEFEKAEAEKLGQMPASFRDAMKNKPDFFTHESDRLVIPGSSLRGMLRSVVEIVSYGKVQAVNDQAIFIERLAIVHH